MSPLEVRLRHDLSRALNNLLNHDYEAFESTFIHLNALLPFADSCRKCCNRLLGDEIDFNVTQEQIDVGCVWPYKRDENAKCFYICPVCGDHWTVGFYGGNENKCLFVSMNDVS
jgi:hypothetical protein